MVNANPNVMLAARLQQTFAQGPIQLANLLKQQSTIAIGITRPVLDSLLGADYVAQCASQHAASKAFLVSLSITPALPEIPDFPAVPSV